MKKNHKELGIGSVEPVRSSDDGTILVSVDLDKRDSEIKLLLGLSAGETALIYEFYNKYDGMKALLIERGEES